MLALVNAAMNIGVHVSFRIRVFVFFRYIARNGIAGNKQMNITKEKQTHRYREQISGYHQGE